MKHLLAALVLFSGITAHADVPSVHGMLLFGKDTTYASHLPMFHKPHDYQAIFKLELAKDDSDKGFERYNFEKEKSDFFTIEPEVMDLTDLIKGRKKQFRTKVYLGHFERGGKLLGHVKAHLKSVVIHTKLNADQDLSGDFWVFGQNGEYFGAHVIKGHKIRPTYDAIVKMTKPYQVQTECTAGPCRRVKKDMPDSQLPLQLEGDLQYADQVPAIGTIIGNEKNAASITQHIYTEFDDLAPNPHH
jgi:hypothetical protein